MTTTASTSVSTPRLRIMHIAECAGGVDKYLRMLLRGMDRGRFEQVVVCSDNYRSEDYEGLADRVIHLPMQNALSAKADARAVALVRRVVREVKPQIVYCHSSKAGGIGRLACVGMGVKVVYNPHGWAFNMQGSRLKRLIYLCMERVLTCLTDQIVVISHREKLSAIAHRVAGERKVRVIFNGVDIASLRRQDAQGVSRRQLGIAEGAYVVGMVGRIAKQKAPDVFVEMAERIVARIPEAHFLIVGDGEERSLIERMIAAKGLSQHFTITGWVGDAAPYIRLFDQAVLLSRWEGFGLVLAEYMVARKAIVATEVDAIPDLLTDGYNALLVPADDAQGAAEAVIYLHDHPTLCDLLIDRAERKALADFDVDRTALEHDRLFVRISRGCPKSR